MAKALKLDVEQPPPPKEDLAFGDINQEKSHPLSLAFIPALMEDVKRHGTSNLYRFQEEWKVIRGPMGVILCSSLSTQHLIP